MVDCFGCFSVAFGFFGNIGCFWLFYSVSGSFSFSFAYGCSGSLSYLVCLLFSFLCMLLKVV